MLSEILIWMYKHPVFSTNYWFPSKMLMLTLHQFRRGQLPTKHVYRKFMVSLFESIVDENSWIIELISEFRTVNVTSFPFPWWLCPFIIFYRYCKRGNIRVGVIFAFFALLSSSRTLPPRENKTNKTLWRKKE